MTTILTRLSKLEARMGPVNQTESSRQLLERLEAGRRRVAQMRERYGLPPREVWPVIGRRRNLTIIEILHRGRAQNAFAHQALVEGHHEPSSGIARERPVSSLPANLPLAYEMARCYADPLDFVYLAYPCVEKGTPLENEEGPV